MKSRIDVACQCPMCNKETLVNVLLDDWCDWMDGELAQNAFPYLSATDREQLISGLCPNCQELIFGS